MIIFKSIEYKDGVLGLSTAFTSAKQNSTDDVANDTYL